MRSQTTRYLLAALLLGLTLQACGQSPTAPYSTTGSTAIEQAGPPPPPPCDGCTDGDPDDFTQ